MRRRGPFDPVPHPARPLLPHETRQAAGPQAPLQRYTAAPAAAAARPLLPHEKPVRAADLGATVAAYDPRSALVQRNMQRMGPTAAKHLDTGPYLPRFSAPSGRSGIPSAARLAASDPARSFAAADGRRQEVGNDPGAAIRVSGKANDTVIQPALANYSQDALRAYGNVAYGRKSFTLDTAVDVFARNELLAMGDKGKSDYFRQLVRDAVRQQLDKANADRMSRAPLPLRHIVAYSDIYRFGRMTALSSRTLGISDVDHDAAVRQFRTLLRHIGGRGLVTGFDERRQAAMKNRKWGDFRDFLHDVARHPGNLFIEHSAENSALQNHLDLSRAANNTFGEEKVKALARSWYGVASGFRLNPALHEIDVWDGDKSNVIKAWGHEGTRLESSYHRDIELTQDPTFTERKFVKKMEIIND